MLPRGSLHLGSPLCPVLEGCLLGVGQMRGEQALREAGTGWLGQRGQLCIPGGREQGLAHRLQGPRQNWRACPCGRCRLLSLGQEGLGSPELWGRQPLR